VPFTVRSTIARAVALALLLATPLARAEVEIDGDAACLARAPLRARLEQVLAAEQRAARLGVEVREARTGALATVTLVARTAWGEALLERRYELAPADCASATELLALVLERFLAGFPAERWRALERRAAEAARDRRLEVALEGAAALELVPTGGSLELGAALEYGSSRHRLGASLLARASLPRALGQGRFLALGVLAGLRYRFAAFAWQPGLELRAGPVLLAGYGFDESYTRAAFGFEVVARLERAFRRLRLGLELGLSPLRHRVLTLDRSASESLPLLFVGVRLALPLHGRAL
jgi:hypothetical protein